MRMSKRTACRFTRCGSSDGPIGLAQFDVHRLKASDSLVVDCQSGLLAHLNSRFVVPLIPRERAPAPAQRLNPIIAILDRDHVMVTQFAAAVPQSELGDIVTSLASRSFEIIGALDVLLSGV